MKVLLISPLPGIDPPCGDIVYTQTLLDHPPEDVQYETYDQAIDRGNLREHGDFRSLKRAAKTPLSLACELPLTAVQKGLNFSRGRHWLFWEPFRFFSVRPGIYDLIHVHVFSVRFFKHDCPIVMSNAAPLRYLYTEARGYSPARVNAIEQIECAAAALLGVNHISYRVPQASRLIAFTQYLKNWYVSRRILPEHRIDVVPIYIPSRPTVLATRIPRTIGFIAKDFHAKGGPTLLKAFQLLRQTRPDAQLVIVGSPPQLSAEEAAAQGIRWIPYIPRRQLLEDIIPSFDVMAYPTQFDGQPLVVIEAMAAGVPVITSDYQAMPEMVDHGRAGAVVPAGDSDALATQMLRLLDPDVNRQCQRATAAWFDKSFSCDAIRPLLRRSYDAALAPKCSDFSLEPVK